MSETKMDYAVATITKLNIPDTTQNRAFLLAWIEREGSKASYNPGATTLNTKGAVSNFNSHGVKNYASFDEGVKAWALTIQGKRYRPILSALQSGDGSRVLSSEFNKMYGAYSGHAKDPDGGESGGAAYIAGFRKIYDNVLRNIGNVGSQKVAGITQNTVNESHTSEAPQSTEIADPNKPFFESLTSSARESINKLNSVISKLDTNQLRSKIEAHPRFSKVLRYNAAQYHKI